MLLHHFDRHDHTFVFVFHHMTVKHEPADNFRIGEREEMSKPAHVSDQNEVAELRLCPAREASIALPARKRALASVRLP
jgi:hypothetical protein